MNDAREIELVLEPLEEGGYHVYAPDLPGLHTEGEDIDDATKNAEEALALYVEGLREDEGSLDTGVSSPCWRDPTTTGRLGQGSVRRPPRPSASAAVTVATRRKAGAVLLHVVQW